MFTDYGIIHQRTVAFTPEKNGVAERQNRTIVEAIRTILHERGCSNSFWAEAVNTVVNVLNISGKSTTDHKTPHELWQCHKPSLKNLHIFGEEAYIHYHYVYDLVDPPIDKVIFGNKCVYKTKYDAKGNVKKRRTRLVTQGFDQKEGIDYTET